MKLEKLKADLAAGAYAAKFTAMYGEANVEAQTARYLAAADAFVGIYGADRDVELFSVAGRSEISGNHTDHNRGCVLAASIDLDIIAVASKTDSTVIRIKSEGFPEDAVDIAAYTAPVESKFFSSESIIAGMAEGFRRNGLAVGGYDAYTTSNVFKGSGLSSSAAFEDMVGNILNHFYNEGKVDNVDVAKMAQFAENVFFGKPCGLMDQMACGVGGFIAIDFADPKNPKIEKPAFDLTAAGYSLCIVNTHGNHADLNEDYASVPAEMKSVAAFFGCEVLREVNRDEFMASIAALREKVGDRAVIRAMHFFAENDRVAAQAVALKHGDLDGFFRGVTASGNSSFKYLQNVYTTKNVHEQGLSLALCLTESFLAGKGGACRVHGGGFAGTIQAFVPHAHVPAYREMIEKVYGEGSCHVLKVRAEGAVKVSI